jgi:hypothetical protein
MCASHPVGSRAAAGDVRCRLLPSQYAAARMTGAADRCQHKLSKHQRLKAPGAKTIVGVGVQKPSTIKRADSHYCKGVVEHSIENGVTLLLG